MPRPRLPRRRSRPPGGPRTQAAALALLLLGLTTPARAFVLSEDPLEERSTELSLMVRSFWFTLAGPVLEPPYNLQDENPSALGLLDLRLQLSHKRSWLKLELHNQLSGAVRSHPATGFLQLGRAEEPTRWLPLQTSLVDDDGLTLRENLDWAYAAVLIGPLTLTVGRQPITLGRGKVWQPLDLVTSFSLTEVDTEYKPGTDAVRLDWIVRPQTQLSLMAAAGTWDDELALRGSTLALRGKQGFEGGEAGLLLGLVRRDVVLGVDGVLDLATWDLYAEVAVHLLTAKSLTPARPQRARAVPRALLGATLKPTTKLTLSPELYYNGFGGWDGADYIDVALSQRVAVGEMYNLGRLYGACIAMWEAHPLLTLTGGVIANLTDPSALISLGLNYSLAGNMSLVAGAYLPAGRVPDLKTAPLPTPRSEFGLYPSFVYLQLKAAM